MWDAWDPVRSDTLSDMISCIRWPDSYQVHNALKPHCMHTFSYRDMLQLSPGAWGNGKTRPQSREHKQWSHTVEIWVYKHSKMTIIRWHCSANESRKLKQQYTVDIQIHRRQSSIISRNAIYQTFVIQSIVHSRDLSLCVLVLVDKISIRKPEESRNLWNSEFLTRTWLFNTYLRENYTICKLKRNQIQGASVVVYRDIMLPWTFCWAFVCRRDVIFQLWEISSLGHVLIQLLLQEVKRLSPMIRRGKKEFLDRYLLLI